MADDIDIEEHDVMEILRRRQQPDTTIVKSEPLEVEYEESSYEYQWEWEKDKVEIKIEPQTDDFQFGKIILGSKPPTPPQNAEETPGGSQDINEEDYNYNMSLVLDDWGPILDRSDCYCKDCEILFATINALDAHKMIAHSFLVVTDKLPSPDRNKAFKSTAKPSNIDSNTCQICKFEYKGVKAKRNLFRHYKNVHQIDPSNVKSNSDFKSWRICNHCNIYFPNDTSLVKHLYELLPLNNKTPTKDDKRTVPAVRPQPVLKVDRNIAVPTNRAPIVKQVISPIKKDTSAIPIPNKIILGSKPMAVQSETNKSDDPNKKTCEICSIEYVKKYYLIHMKRFHPDFLTKKQQQPNKIILNDTHVRYKCMICSEILTTKYWLRKHRHKHPDMKNKRLFLKLVSKVKVKPDLIKKGPLKTKPTMVKKVYPSKVKKEVAEDSKDALVSKSTLFKCNKCSVHFLTCTGACQHSIACETSSNIRDWACPQCQRVFKSAEKTAHEYQHKILSNKGNNFNVYVVYLEMIVRILCQCPNCFVWFEEDKFWRHVNGGCHDAASYFCNECKIPIDIHSKSNHDSKHKKGGFKKSDFIKVDYVFSKPQLALKKIKTIEQVKSPAKLNTKGVVPKRALKRKLEMPASEVQRKIRKDSDRLLLLHCQFCKAYLAVKSDMHLSGNCKAKEKAHKICKICGIYLRKTYHETHMKLHVQCPNLTIADITFVKLSDSKKIRPVQEFHPCRTCKVMFLTKRARKLHKCGETPSTHCPTCQKNIQIDFFDAHTNIHNYVIPREIKSITEMMQSPSSVSESPQKLSRKETASPMTKLPDLLMKYQSLTALWNILYLCAVCDTFTDSYDKVVEHCQNHLTNMENYDVVIKKCDKCDMKFDSECYKRHLELHAGNKVISKKTFQILKYEHYDLFSDKWFDFIDLPEEQKSQIVSRSIYGANRCVKMKLVQQGPPECTLYKCEKCSNCVGPDTIVYHVKLANCCKANKIPCTVCEMTFAIRHDCEEHESMHETTGLGLQSFRIVSFNDANDAEANQTIMSYDTEENGSKRKISVVDDEIAPKAPKQRQNSAPLKSLVFYKCAECLTCVAHVRNFPKHACISNKTSKKYCNECGLWFGNLGFSRHRMHHQKYTFTRKNVITKILHKDGTEINVKKQNPDKKSVLGNTQNTSKDTDQKSKLYKCFCGLHYTSLKAIERHYKLKNCSTVIREKCSQCNLVFDPIEVVNHLCKHHAQSQVKTFNIITPNKKTLYKCGLCHILFYNKAAAIPHKAKCIGKFCGKKCEKCGLAFDVTSIATHMVDHERNNKLRNDCYVIVKIPDEKITPVAKGHPSILYKCKSCDIHFLRRTSAWNHITKKTDCGTTVADTCKICRRKFPAVSIMKHVAWQHNKLKIKEFNVRELIFGVNTNLPKTLPKDDNKEDVVNRNITKEIEVLPKKETVQVTVYRCMKCMLHFTNGTSLLCHLEDRCSKELTDECEECNVKFASKNIKDHNKHHGPGIDLLLTIVEDVESTITGDVEKEINLNRPYDPKEYQLYKCTVCNLHFLNKTTLRSHDCRPYDGFECEICELAFTKYSLSRHKSIHERYNFKKEDVVVLTLADGVQTPSIPDDVTTERNENQNPIKAKDILARYDNKLYKCTVCNLHYLTQATLEKHPATDCNPNRGINCEICDIAFTGYSLRRHKLIHDKYDYKKEDFVIFTLDKLEPRSSQRLKRQEVLEDTSLDSTLELESTEKSPDKPKTEKPKNDTQNSNIHFLFKCAECNVYFNTRLTCHKHISQHTPLDPKEYIECKLCGFQFTIMGLPSHIKKHHANSFNLEEVLVEEYQPNNIKKHETYYASDKDQSALVSTSEDVRNGSNLRKENDCEVSSCNEIYKADSSDNSSLQGNLDITDDKIKVGDQITNEFKERTETNFGKGTINVDSSDNNVTMMDIDVVEDQTKVNDQESKAGVIIDSTDNAIQVNKDVIADKTEIDDEASNNLKEITAAHSTNVNVQVDSSNERPQVDMNAEKYKFEEKSKTDSRDINLLIDSSDNNCMQINIDDSKIIVFDKVTDNLEESNVPIDSLDDDKTIVTDKVTDNSEESNVPIDSLDDDKTIVTDKVTDNSEESNVAIDSLDDDKTIVTDKVTDNSEESNVPIDSLDDDKTIVSDKVADKLEESTVPIDSLDDKTISCQVREDSKEITEPNS